MMASAVAWTWLRSGRLSAVSGVGTARMKASAGAGSSAALRLPDWIAARTTVDALRTTLVDFYKDARFVQVMDAGVAPSTHQVRGTNLCRIGVFADARAGRAVIVSVIDNLVKGALIPACPMRSLRCANNGPIRRIRTFLLVEFVVSSTRGTPTCCSLHARLNSPSNNC